MLFFSLNVKIPNTLVLMKWDNIYVLASEASSSSRIPQKKVKKAFMTQSKAQFLLNVGFLPRCFTFWEWAI